MPSFFNGDFDKKERSIYKSIYLPESYIKKINKIASDKEVSFNKVVVSMIEYCLEDTENND